MPHTAPIVFTPLAEAVSSKHTQMYVRLKKPLCSEKYKVKNNKNTKKKLRDGGSDGWWLVYFSFSPQLFCLNHYCLLL